MPEPGSIPRSVMARVNGVDNQSNATARNENTNLLSDFVFMFFLPSGSRNLPSLPGRLPEFCLEELMRVRSFAATASLTHQPPRMDQASYAPCRLHPRRTHSRFLWEFV